MQRNMDEVGALHLSNRVCGGEVLHGKKWKEISFVDLPADEQVKKYICQETIPDKREILRWQKKSNSQKQI